MDGSEIEALYRRLGPFIYRRCVRILRDPEKARDATQEVFVRVIRHRASIRDEQGYLPYIYRIATNFCLNMIRDGRFETPAAVHETRERATAPAQEHAASARQMVEAIGGRVDDATMAIACMAIVDGMTQDEIALVLKLSRKTVGKKLTRFKEVARGMFGE